MNQKSDKHELNISSLGRLQLISFAHPGEHGFWASSDRKRGEIYIFTTLWYIYLENNKYL